MALALVTSVIAAMAGVGGGFLYVPLLTLVFGLGPADAVGTSLVVIVVTTLAASLSYLKQGRVFFRSALCLIIPGVAGAMIGAFATAFLPGALIGFMFAVIVGFLSIKLLFPSFPFIRPIECGPSCDESCHDCFSVTAHHRIFYLQYLVWGLASGLASGLIGIGGGVINVPALVTAGMPLHFATATSTLVVLCTSVTGGGIHAVLGHVNLLYASLFSGGAVLGGYLGARYLAPRAPEGILRTFIGLLFALVALAMGISSVM
ncbi:MAG: sulfite exporter TauE/SafE family protein [Methanoregulaceae archaeon]|nr:sulfite exporter TauE/SafE family protein [Methanoregulaceae archaeon]